MIIYLNEQPLSLGVPCTLQEMLEQTERITDHMAIAVNHQFVPKLLFSSVILHEGDRVDLIVPMQGG